MATQITLPNLGENIESGDVLSILVSEGDTIKADQDVIEVETDKATMPIPSPQAGKVVKLLVAEGDTIKIGTAILEIDAGGNGAAVGQGKDGTLQRKSTAEPKQEDPSRKRSKEEDIPPPPDTDIPAVVECRR